MPWSPQSRSRGALGPLLPLLVTGCGVLSSISAQPVRDSVTTVPYRSESGLVIVDVQLEDGDTYPFMLDTGFSTSAIDRDLVERLSLRRRGSVRMHDYQEHSGRLGVYTLRSLALGDAEFRDVGAIAVDGGWDGVSCTEPFAGILGSNVMALGAVEIDDRTKTVHLASGDAQLPPRSGGTTYSFTAGHLYPNVQVPIEGTSMGFLFDTGNPTAIDILPSITKNFPSSPSAVCASATSAWGLFGPQTDAPQPCGAFVWPADVGAPQLRGVVARDANTNMLGAGLLPYFTVRVDYKAGSITMWRNDHPIDTTMRSHGIDLACDESGALFIGAVWQGSGAASAGVHEGDRVTELIVDGQPVASPCGCESPCGCGLPRDIIEHAETLEVAVASEAGRVRLNKADMLLTESPAI